MYSNINSSNKLLIQKIKVFAEKMMQDYPPGHNFLHIMRVHELAKHIAQKEKADLLIVETAALLHDIGRKYELRNPKINHADKSAEIALPFLRKLSKDGKKVKNIKRKDEKNKKTCFPENKIPAVLYAIKNHRFTKGVIRDTIEAKVL